jgi:hypothetical protein
MITPLNLSNINGMSIIREHHCSNIPTIFYWFAFGKLPENPVITPSTTTQVIYPSANNKFLQSVTVNPIPSTPTQG